MSWLIDAKVRAIDIDIFDTNQSSLKVMHMEVAFWKFKQRRKRTNEINRLNAYRQGLEKAREILQNRNIK